MYVRIRGIYATALTKLLLDNGIKITQPTPPIIERFKINNILTVPPDVTIKDLNEKNGVVIIGEEKVAQKITEIFIKNLNNIIVKRYKPLLYSVYKGIIEDIKDNEIIVNLGDMKGILLDTKIPQNLEVGKEIIVSVRKTRFNQPPLLSTQIVVSGKYMRFIKGYDKISFSEHIRNLSKRRELLTLGFMIRPQGWGIRWRSSAKYASSEELLEEAKMLKEKIKELGEKIEKSKAPSLLEKGEAIIEILFTLEAKKKLDKIRDQVIPTVENHHLFKNIGKYTEHIDFIESLLKYNVPKEPISQALLNYHLDKLINPSLQNVILLQRYIDGNILEIKGSFYKRLSKDTVIIYRKFSADGYYDGLNIPKEENDYGLTLVKLFYPCIIHFYFNKNDELKGIYVNINTPVELYDVNTFTYIDLEVDVIVKPNEDPKIIDYNKFKKYLDLGVIPLNYANKINSQVNEIANFLKKHKDKLNDVEKMGILINEIFKPQVSRLPQT